MDKYTQTIVAIRFELHIAERLLQKRKAERLRKAIAALRRAQNEARRGSK